MKIISRAAAKASGLMHYYTGKPCKHGHYAARLSSKAACTECNKRMQANYSNTNPLYACWKNMRYRCTNENAANYDNYGGRGITVCDRWLDPENGYDNFVADMGPCPDGFTLDRIDYDGNYEPSNCRWADRATQDRNKRSTKLKGEDVIEVYRLVDSGVLHKDVAALYNCGKSTIWLALKNREKYIEQGLGRSTQAA